jgi:hypothetical protein
VDLLNFDGWEEELMKEVEMIVDMKTEAPPKSKNEMTTEEWSEWLKNNVGKYKHVSDNEYPGY